MDISLFDYKLPKELISHKLLAKRDDCKLLVYSKEKESIDDKKFKDILDLFKAGDVLVLNNTKVIPSRLFGNKDTGGAVEVLVVSRVKGRKWKVLIKGKVRSGQKIYIKKSGLMLRCEYRDQNAWIVTINASYESLLKELHRVGRAPLPPYISSDQREKDIRLDYQTVYSQHAGSVAAPTAGLHFTKELLNNLQEKGVIIEYITLHVGLGTFSPVRSQNISKHTMHSEEVYVPRRVMQAIVRAKQEGRRVVAVGTTSVRVLEGVVKKYLKKRLRHMPAFKGKVNIYIYPGYRFEVVDALITNFHLPKSSLIILVSAFMGIGECMRAYKHAVKKKYLFYSLGDSMFIY